MASPVDSVSASAPSRSFSLMKNKALYAKIAAVALTIIAAIILFKIGTTGLATSFCVGALVGMFVSPRSCFGKLCT